jgi:hypothetical protein
MKKCIAVILAAGTVLLAGCCATSHVTKWEYKVAFAPGPQPGANVAIASSERRALQEKFLNELGKEGWVLVMGRPEADNAFYFKRPVK